MSSRETILNKLRQQELPQVALPEVVEGNWLQFEDCLAKFSEMVTKSGGTCEAVSNVREIRARLESIPTYRTAQRIFSAVDGVPGNVDLSLVDQPHALADLDFVVYPGRFGVAENGAIWLTDQDLRHRVSFFITQYLVLVVRADTIVHNMHQAYQLAQPPQPGFGLFLAGPSKTADIEQSLVIGAHGCRELMVFLIAQ